MAERRACGSLAVLLVAVVVVPASIAGLTPTAAQGGFEFQAAAGGQMAITVGDSEQPVAPQMFGGQSGGGYFISGPAGLGESSIVLGDLGGTNSSGGLFNGGSGPVGGVGDVGGYPTGGTGGPEVPSVHAPAPAAVALGMIGVGVIAALRRRLS